MMSDTDIKDRIRSAMFSGMSMSLRDDLCEMLDDLWFETATQAAALTDAEATIAALTEAFGDIQGPAEPGGFIGDIYFGDDSNSTRGTHRWDGTGWHKLPTDAAALCQLLAKERATIAYLTQANRDLGADNARLGKRVGDARGLIDRGLWLTQEAPAARAWLAGGDAE